MSTIAFIPARGGSKRIPRKNLAGVGGVTLLGRAITCARVAGCTVVVSTDDDEIAIEAHAHGFGLFDRFTVHAATAPIHSDTAQIEDAIAHWLRRATVADDDVIALTQCTSPFRRPETVRRCVEWVASGRHDVCVAVTRDAARVHFNGRIRGVYDESADADVGYEVRWNNPPDYRPRSQDCRNDGVDRGTCWAFRVGHFRATGLRMAQRTGAVLVSKWEALDVDSPADLEAARILAPHVERLIAEDV